MKGYTALLKSSIEGDKQAFGELVKAFEGLAVSEAVKHLEDKSLVQDAVQEAFLTAYLRLSDLNNLSAFPSWFKKIVRTCCRKLRNQYSSCLLDPTTLYDLADPRPTPYDAMVNLEDRAGVRKILKLLHENVREVFVQRYIHDLSYNEISDMLGVPVGTVKSRLHDARTKFIHHYKTQNSSVIRVGYLPVSDHLVAMVAHQMHDQKNYSILLKKYLSWSSLVNALKAEHLDAAFIMAPLALSLRAGGMPIIYVLDAHQDGSAITVQKDASYKQENIHGRIGLPHAISTHSMILHHMLGDQPSESVENIETRYINPSYLNKSGTKSW